MRNGKEERIRKRKLQVGDQIKVKLHDGRRVDATVRAVYQQDDETKLNIDYGHEETATIELWQVDEKIR